MPDADSCDVDGSGNNQVARASVIRDPATIKSSAHRLMAGTSAAPNVVALLKENAK
jgi:hypothetical protein